MKDITATDMKKQQWQQDQERKIQDISAANKNPTWTTRMFPRARLDEGDKSDIGSDNDLSNTSRVSSSATLEPARVSQKKGSAREPEDDNGGSEKKDEDNAVSQTQVSLVICEEDTHTNHK
jgi:chromatin remodeling complex protein RSC6